MVLKSLWKSTPQQKLMLACMALSHCLCFMSFSIMAPFYPREAQSRGVSLSIAGWVFGICPLVQFLSSPLFGLSIAHVGPKFQFLSGNFFTGGSTLLFGFLEMMPYAGGPLMFISFSFIIRIFLGLGISATTTAIFAIATYTFKDDLTVVMGILESLCGIGLMMGPAVGGFLFKASGFKGPFLTVGGVMIASVIVCQYAVNLQEDKEDKSKKDVDGEKVCYGELLRIRPLLVCLLLVFVASCLWISLDPSLEPHLRQFQLSSVQLGQVFLLMSGSYAIVSPLVGHVSDTISNSSPLIATGFALQCVALLLMGPSAVIGIQDYRHLWLNLVSLVVMAFGNSLVVIPSFGKLYTYAGEAGLKHSIKLYSLIGALFNSVNSLGEFVGPIISGHLMDHVGFPWTMTIMAGASIAMMMTTSVLWVYETCDCYQPRPPDQTPIMDNHAMYTVNK